VQRSEHTIRIAATPSRLFAWLSEPELMARWIGGLREFRPLDPEPGAGARATQVVELGGRRLEVRSVLTRFEPGESLEARLTGKGFEVETAYRLEPDGDRTALHATVATRLHGLAGRLLGGVVDRGAQRKLEADLARLKELAEREP
jgi:carbon monoxide dehydrogenase subunit G